MHLWAWPRAGSGCSPHWWRQWVSLAARSGAQGPLPEQGWQPRGPRCGGVNRKPPSRLPDLQLCWKAGHRCPGRLQGWSRLRAPGQQAGPRLPVGATRKWRLRQGVGWGDGGPTHSLPGETVKALRCFSGSVCLCGPPLPGRSRGPPLPSSPSVPFVRRRSFYYDRGESLLGPEQEAETTARPREDSQLLA